MTLNARLLTGLLSVTLAGLLVMGAVSGLVLHGYLMHRVDGQLQATRDRAVPRLLRPGLPEQGVAPARFVVAHVTAAGQVRILSGPDPDPSRAAAELRELGPGALAERAASLEPFSLPGLRAVARAGRNGNTIVVAAPLDEVRAAVRNLVLTELITALVLLAVLALVGRHLIRRGLLPLDRMAATAHAITAGGDLRARMPSGPGARTETGRLAAAINVMLDRIEQAFWARSRSEARVREFAADASHELRTPLTTIQGYAELYRHGALGPAELPAAMARIEAEAQRMNSLVTDLLELARLDREATLDPAAVDLVALAREAVRDAGAAGPAPFALDAPDALVATVDEARVRQVLANLLANVRTHTPPGTPATVRLYRAPDAVVIEVADEGPGMPPDDAARAFERFHRAGRASGSPGAGLGLPIVAAIAAAHNGRAELLSAPGKGTTVRVTLPQATS
ncbi:sensor histidine kinase [Actinomadura macrotermitis]|uniref:histidine kinase n=1 Tax=Actinomadura macrotermitis TaxID=2585200 RepID=A0A7K0BVS8_9ACTN|nr:HAMP domain-containing sensor histidine kinase [Actinomadura macrotermitis]MQY05002.1 Adaptive-response sensory-kinase SasA [Actinomadura macrotermitis]